MSEINDYSTLYTLTGKTAVITGGSRGLGLHAATGLLHAGCSTVVINSRNADACAATVNSLQPMFPKATISAIPADLSKPEEVKRFVAELAKQVSIVHILIANAGATWNEQFETHPDFAFAKVMDLNVRSVFNLIRDMLPLLEGGGSLQDPARVITVGSVAGISAVGPRGGTFGYSASKAALHHLSKNLAVTLGPKGILVNAIAPGFFVTKLAAKAIDRGGGEKALGENCPNRRLGRPDDIAGVVNFLCSRAASHVNGVVIPIDGGQHLAPQSKI